MTAVPALPPFPQTLPKSQADWQAVVNTFQQWRQLLQGQKWVAPAFQNSWGNYDAIHPPAGYYVDLSSRVWLRGLIAGGSNGSVAFTLPYAPPYVIHLASVVDASSNVIAADIAILMTGTVSITWTSGSLVWATLDSCSFSLLP